ncbi:MAG TPA: glycosyltransferase family 2 protein [Chthoniobacterales bacterium]
MIVHLYTLCWNEENILPFFLRHYTPLVDQIFVANDGSTDRSEEILSECPLVTFREFDGAGDSFAFAQQKDSNEAWKYSKGIADWVIICDADEFLYHENFRQYLADCAAEGITVLPARGFQMVAEEFPPEDWELAREVVRGMPYDDMSKTIVFNPNAIEGTRFTPGKHLMFPTGRCVFPSNIELKLLHYKYLGREYLVRRHQELFTRRRRVDLERHFGFQYLRTPEENSAEFEKVKRLSTQVVPGRPGTLVDGAQAVLDRALHELSAMYENARTAMALQWYHQMQRSDQLEACVQDERMKNARLTDLLRETQKQSDRRMQTATTLDEESLGQPAALGNARIANEQQDYQLTSLTAEITQLTDLLRAAETQNERQFRNVAALRTENSQLPALLDNDQMAHEQQNRPLTTLTRDSTRRKISLSEAEADKERHNRQINGLTEEMDLLMAAARGASEREKRAADRIAKLEMEREKLRQQRQTLREKNATVMKYRELYRTVTRSFSWKMTSPLRRISRFFTGGGKT